MLSVFCTSPSIFSDTKMHRSWPWPTVPYTKYHSLSFCLTKHEEGKRWLIQQMALQCMLNHFPRGGGWKINMGARFLPTYKYLSMQQTSPPPQGSWKSKPTPSQEADCDIFQNWVFTSFSSGFFFFFLEFGLNCIDCTWLYTVKCDYSW